MAAKPAPSATFQELQAALETFDGCALRTTATSLVLRDGNPQSGLVLIGEAPSDDDDREGRPFSGPGGQVLDRVFGSIGLDRTQMMLTMLVPWRPPGKRSPSTSEIQACLPFLWQHLAIVRPRRLVLFGGLVTRALGLGADNIARLRGRWTEITAPDVGSIAVLPMRPVELSLKTALHKRELWADLLSLRMAIGPAGKGDSGDHAK